MKQLMIAVEKGNLEEVQSLLNTGLDINTSSSEYLYYIYSARVPSDRHSYELIYDGKDKFPQALHKAAMGKNLDIYKLLLSKTNVPPNPNRLLCKIIEDGVPLNDVTRFLINEIESIDNNLIFSKTPLHSTAMVGNLDIFKLLVGKFPAHKSIEYKTPDLSDPYLDTTELPISITTQTPLDCVILGIKKNYNSFKNFDNHDSNIVRNYIQILSILVSSKHIVSYLKAHLVESEILNLYADVPEFLDLNTLPEEQHKKLNSITLINKIKEIFNTDSDFRKFYIETQTAQVDVVANRGFLNQAPKELKNKWETLYNNLLFLQVKGFIAIKLTENNNLSEELNKKNPATEFPYALTYNKSNISETKEDIKSLDEAEEHPYGEIDTDYTANPQIIEDPHNNVNVDIKLIGSSFSCILL